MMKLAAKLSWRERGKAIELNSKSDTMKLISPTGELLGARSRDAVMDFIQLPRPRRRLHDQPLRWGTSMHPQPFEAYVRLAGGHGRRRYSDCPGADGSSHDHNDYPLGPALRCSPPGRRPSGQPSANSLQTLRWN